MTSRMFPAIHMADRAIPPMAIGTWSWGEKRQWNYEEKKDFPLIQQTWHACNAAGLTFYDTAEVYGFGESENIIGRLLKETNVETRCKIILASKVIPFPIPNLHFYLFTPPAEKALRATNARLGINQLDLYQLHSYPLFGSLEAWAQGLAQCQLKGLCKSVGVSNFSTDEMIKFDGLLQNHGVKLASNQVEFNLLRQLPDTKGMLKECQARGITLLAYSPLAMGRLTGKYSAEKKIPKNRRFSAQHTAEAIEPLLEEMRSIATKYDVSVSAIALNWVIVKGAVPLGGARNADQASQNGKAISFRLTEAEVETLSRLGFEGKADGKWQHG